MLPLKLVLVINDAVVVAAAVAVGLDDVDVAVVVEASRPKFVRGDPLADGAV